MLEMMLYMSLSITVMIAAAKAYTHARELQFSADIAEDVSAIVNTARGWRNSHSQYDGIAGAIATPNSLIASYTLSGADHQRHHCTSRAWWWPFHCLSWDHHHNAFRITIQHRGSVDIRVIERLADSLSPGAEQVINTNSADGIVIVQYR